MNARSMHVVITAGGTSPADFAQAIGSPYKALAPVGSRCCIDLVVDAARGLAPAGIAVIAPDAVAAHLGTTVDRIVPAAGDGIINITRALNVFPDATQLLYLTCDLPFLTTPALADFIARAGTVAVAMALADGASYIAEYPGAADHTIALGTERIANGSVFLIDRAAIAPVEAAAGRFFRARKSLPRLAMLLGPRLLAKFALRRLRIADIEARARTVLGVEARAVRGCSPSLCYDIDSAAEWAYARNFRRSASP